MPAPDGLRAEYGESKPLPVHASWLAHMTIQTAVLIETLVVLVPMWLGVLQYLLYYPKTPLAASPKAARPRSRLRASRWRSTGTIWMKSSSSPKGPN